MTCIGGQESIDFNHVHLLVARIAWIGGFALFFTDFFGSH